MSLTARSHYRTIPWCDKIQIHGYSIQTLLLSFFSEMSNIYDQEQGIQYNTLVIFKIHLHEHYTFLVYMCTILCSFDATLIPNKNLHYSGIDVHTLFIMNY
jgi:hypothetical protein